MSAPIGYRDVWMFPKTDVHLHIDGALPLKTVIHLAKKHGVILPTYDADEFSRLYSINGLSPETGLFERFAWAIAVMRTRDGIIRAVVDLVKALRHENIWYAELRFAPGYHSRRPPAWYVPERYERRPFRVLSLDEVVAAVLTGMKLGQERFGVMTNLTLCIPRECVEQYGEAAAMEIAALALRWQRRGVVSLDIACFEPPYPPEIFTRAFAATFGSRLFRNPHAGEMGEKGQRNRNVWTCMHEHRVSGIGHAYDVTDDPALMEEMQESSIRIERHPLGVFSQRSLRGQRLDELLRRHMLLTIVSDDPALYQQTLTQNILAVLLAYGWGKRELHQLVANGVKSGFYRSKKQRRAVETLFVQQGLDPKLLVA